MPNLLTRKQVAQILQVSPLTVYRWERLGKLPVLHIGENAVRYTQETVSAFLEASKMQISARP
jgi:excisionase family DNA binding protein